MPSPRDALQTRRILVVEDNYLIGEHVRSVLERAGCDVLGPVGRLGPALELVRATAALDGAVLDINLDGQTCFPVATALAERAVPFFFLTGYDNLALIPAEFAARTVLPKPLDAARLIELAATTFAA